MLWMKHWMETRWRLLLACTVFVVFALLGANRAPGAQDRPNPIPAEQQLQGPISLFSLFLIIQSVSLAGSGIKTQAPFRTGKGLHGSAHFTLSLPVSRTRLLASRMSMGALELLAAIGVGMLALAIMLPMQFPELNLSVLDMARYAFTLFSCLSAAFSVSTLFATFLDDLWQVWGSLIVIGALGGLASLVSLPPVIDPFWAIADGSPLVTHTIPWGAIAISLAFATALSVAAAKIVQRRDY